MAIHSLHVAGYRSVRDLHLKLGRVNVLVGPNGCGKSNLYQAMYLLASAARGELARTFAMEGGMPSALWAGPRDAGPVRMVLSAEIDNLEYELQCGLPATEPPDPFKLDPDVKSEVIRHVRRDAKGKATRRTLLQRRGGMVWARDEKGLRADFPYIVTGSESALASLRDPHRFPQISALAVELQSWRFYHGFRSDTASPIRRPQPSYSSLVLRGDGRNLVAALLTIMSVGDKGKLLAAIDRAFPGAELEFVHEGNRAQVSLKMPGLGRALDARELSDGTLRYLCLLAALLTPRPPKVLALNEPESSLHPDLLAPLGKLIAEASHETQLWITTHSRELAWAIEEHSGASPVKLHKVEDETRLVLPDPEVVEPATPVVTSDGGDADETEERTVSVRYVFD